MSGSTDREIMTIEEAAALLGVSIKTFNKVLHSEHMPARKIGREWKFSRKALIDWVGSGSSQEYYRDATVDEHSRDIPRPNSTKRTRRTAGWSIDNQ